VPHLFFFILFASQDAFKETHFNSFYVFSQKAQICLKAMPRDDSNSMHALFQLQTPVLFLMLFCKVINHAWRPSQLEESVDYPGTTFLSAHRQPPPPPEKWQKLSRSVKLLC
jgi:hypothetical protein